MEGAPSPAAYLPVQSRSVRLRPPSYIRNFNTGAVLLKIRAGKTGRNQFIKKRAVENVCAILHA
jgi:hypothetical protein